MRLIERLKTVRQLRLSIEDREPLLSKVKEKPTKHQLIVTPPPQQL